MKFDLSTAHSTAANVPNNQKPTAQSQKKSWWCHFFRWEKSSPKHLFQYQISGIELMTSRTNSKCSSLLTYDTKQKEKTIADTHTQQLPVVSSGSLYLPLFLFLLLSSACCCSISLAHTSTTYQQRERERETSGTGTTGRIDPRDEHCTCVYTSRVPGVLFSADFVNLMREEKQPTEKNL
jgi:hypothetical protein